MIKCTPGSIYDTIYEVTGFSGCYAVWFGIQTTVFRRNILSNLQSSINIYCSTYVLGHAVAQWLRHCATNRKVAGSIPDGVI
jgi:hypothetical protein